MEQSRKLINLLSQQLTYFWRLRHCGFKFQNAHILQYTVPNLKIQYNKGCSCCKRILNVYLVYVYVLCCAYTRRVSCKEPRYHKRGKHVSNIEDQATFPATTKMCNSSSNLLSTQKITTTHRYKKKRINKKIWKSLSASGNISSIHARKKYIDWQKTWMEKKLHGNNKTCKYKYWFRSEGRLNTIPICS